MAHLYGNTEITDLLKQRFGNEAVERDIAAVDEEMKALVLEHERVFTHDASDPEDTIVQSLSDMEEQDDQELAQSYKQYNQYVKPTLRAFDAEVDWASGEKNNYESDWDSGEEGLSSNLVASMNEEDIHEAIQLFERVEKGEWIQEYSDYDYQIVHVESRYPRREVLFPVKRKRDVSEEKELSAKRVRVEMLDDKIIERSSLVFPKHEFNRWAISIVTNYKNDTELTPLALFMLQSAAESKLENLFKLATEYAAFHRRDFVCCADLEAAVHRMQTIHKQKPTQTVDAVESDHGSAYSCGSRSSTSETDISSERSESETSE